MEFLSDTWRLTFLTWQFFAIMAVVAAVLTIAVTILGIICFRNFGEGLSNYLKPEEPREGEGFVRMNPDLDLETSSRASTDTMEEKIAFPEMNSIPAYTLTYAKKPAPTMPAMPVAPSPRIPPLPHTVEPNPPPMPARPLGALPKENPFRPESMMSTSTHASDRDPFYLAERLSMRISDSPPLWSKESNERKAKPAGKRWVIE